LGLYSLFLAPYIKPCARSQPNFNECALEHAKDVFPHMIKGKVLFYLVSLSRPSHLNAKSLFIWENIKADVAYQVPDFEESKTLHALDHVVAVIGRFRFLKKKDIVRETYINTKVRELKKYKGKEL